MTLSGNYVSFRSIIERVYREAGYQQINWADALEYVADVLRLIGDNSIFVLTSTNGLYGNPAPIEITDYRGALPAGMINFKAVRKIEIADDGTISNFYPMIYSTDLFHQTPSNKIFTEVPSGTYNTYDWQLQEDGSYIVTPITVVGERAYISNDYVYTYRTNNTYIETSFECGYVEILYTGFKLDESGFPMIPDNVKIEKAVETYIIERLDYKKWRFGEITDKVYAKSVQEREWYMKSAQSAVSIPSIDQMESLKNNKLYFNINTDEHNTGFKFMNIPRTRK